MSFSADISCHWNLNKAGFEGPQYSQCVPSSSKVERQRKAEMRLPETVKVDQQNSTVFSLFHFRSFRKLICTSLYSSLEVDERRKFVGLPNTRSKCQIWHIMERMFDYKSGWLPMTEVSLPFASDGWIPSFPGLIGFWTCITQLKPEELVDAPSIHLCSASSE